MPTQAAASCRTHRADALIQPDVALLLLRIRGLQRQQVPAGAQAVVVAQHAHNQVERVPMQNILAALRLQTFMIINNSLCWICTAELTHWSNEATLTPYLDTPRTSSLSSGTKGSFPSCCQRSTVKDSELINTKTSPPVVSHLSGINVGDELQRLLQGLAHAELQLLDGSHILDAELGARLRRAVAFSGVTGGGGETKEGNSRDGGMEAGTDRSSWWSLCRGWRPCWIWTVLPDWSPRTIQEEFKHSSRAGRK